MEDVAGLVKQFDAVKNRLKQAGKSPDIYGYKTAGLLRQAIEDLGASKGSEKRRLKQEETTYLGTFGDWTVAMPHTKESSCQLGKGTTWCTAATQSQNLFLSYVAGNEENIILYYLIKKGGDSRTDPTAKISVGFVNGKPYLQGTDGHITVDAANKGYTEKELRSVLGDQYEPIMDAMKAHAAKIGGKHPAKEQMKKIAKDPVALEKETANMATDERYYFIKQVLNSGPSLEVFEKISNDEDYYIRKLVAENPSTPSEVLLKIVQNRGENFKIRLFAMKNPSMPIESLVKLADSQLAGFRSAVALNPSTPPEVLSRLSGDEHGTIKNSVALNPSTPPEVLAKLADNEDTDIVLRVAQNPSTPPEVLAKLADNEDTDIRAYVAQNPSTPPEVLTRLSDRGEEYVRWTVAENPSTPPEVLAKLSNDEGMYVRERVASNPNTPIEILLALYNTENVRLRTALGYNPTYIAYKEKQGGLLDEKKNSKTSYSEGKPMDFTEEYIKQVIKEEYDALLDEKKKKRKKKKKKACKPSKGKRFAKRVNGKCRSYGQAGKAKGGGDRIRPGTKKGDAYCARSAKIKKCKNPPCANDLSRKKWKCRGSKSMK